jgi:hypothetical protein
MTQPVTCSRCTQVIEYEAEIWPDDKDGHLCQMCWEAYCSGEWWKECAKVQEYAEIVRQFDAR